MFGVIISGRLPTNAFERVSETQFLIKVPDVDVANHIVVFMTGEMPFPAGFAGAVYFSYAGDGGEQKWIYLGKISNEKPSAIFKISNLKHDSNHVSVTPFGGMDHPQSNHTQGMIGISVETEQTIDSLTPATSVQPNEQITFTQKMLEAFYNYAASFSKDGGDGQQYVPLTTLHTWFANFKRRLEINPNFWKN